jgi:hypothetical protein
MADTVKFVAPTDEELAKLKATYVKIYRIAFSEDEAFYIRRVKRQEYRRIVELVGKVDPTLREDMLNEKLVEAAVVWSKPEVNAAFFSDSGAGVVPTLAVQIMDRSGFTNQIDVAEV